MILNETQGKLDISRDRLFSSIVILANPNEDRYGLAQKLKELGDVGYSTGHLPSPIHSGRYYSEALEGFLSVLEGSSFTNGSFTDASSLSEDGRDHLERVVLKGYVTAPRIVGEMSESAKLDLRPILQRHLERYLNSE